MSSAGGSSSTSSSSSVGSRRARRRSGSSGVDLKGDLASSFSPMHCYVCGPRSSSAWLSYSGMSTSSSSPEEAAGELLSQCVRCGIVHYCSRECQRIHWDFHRPWCRESYKLIKQQLMGAEQVYQDPSSLGVASALGGKSGVRAHTTARQEEARDVMKRFTASHAKGEFGRRGHVGLDNLGNSCYMSSGVQALAHILPLTRHFLSNRFQDDVNVDNFDGTGGQLVSAYTDLLKKMWFGTGKSLTPSTLKRVMGTKVNEDYQGLAQQDINEGMYSQVKHQHTTEPPHLRHPSPLSLYTNSDFFV